jgi:hypothetical protein
LHIVCVIDSEVEDVDDARLVLGHDGPPHGQRLTDVSDVVPGASANPHSEIREGARNGQSLGDPIGEEFAEAGVSHPDQYPIPPGHAGDGTRPILDFLDGDRDRALSRCSATHDSSTSV